LNQDGVIELVGNDARSSLHRCRAGRAQVTSRLVGSRCCGRAGWRRAGHAEWSLVALLRLLVGALRIARAIPARAISTHAVTSIPVSTSAISTSAVSAAVEAA